MGSNGAFTGVFVLAVGVCFPSGICVSVLLIIHRRPQLHRVDHAAVNIKRDCGGDMAYGR